MLTFIGFEPKFFSILSINQYSCSLQSDFKQNFSHKFFIIKCFLVNIFSTIKTIRCFLKS